MLHLRLPWHLGQSLCPWTTNVIKYVGVATAAHAQLVEMTCLGISKPRPSKTAM